MPSRDVLTWRHDGKEQFSMSYVGDGIPPFTWYTMIHLHAAHAWKPGCLVHALYSTWGETGRWLGITIDFAGAVSSWFTLTTNPCRQHGVQAGFYKASKKMRVARWAHDLLGGLQFASTSTSGKFVFTPLQIQVGIPFALPDKTVSMQQQPLGWVTPVSLPFSA